MILNKIFDKIFVINLKESTDRHEHIVQEFKRMNIHNYEFFEASHYDDPEVHELLQSDKVMKFPPCFRCLKKRCSCENNFLTKYQIANWLSFIRLFQHILSTKHQFVCICEDDIAFTKHANVILHQTLSRSNFRKYNIQMNGPLLIKMGAAFDYPTHYYFGKTEFIKNYSLSNPCFALNRSMIQVFLSNLKIIDYHSDIYFHKKIPQYFGNKIQMFTMKPYPIYELSFVKSIRKFTSLVRPQNQVRRKEFKEFLFITMTKLLECIPFKYASENQLHILNTDMGYSGTINYYFHLQKEKYHFEHKIFIYDNKKEDIPFIQNQLKLQKNNYFKELLKIMGINEFKEDDYEKIISYFKKEKFTIVSVQKDPSFFSKANIDNYSNIKTMFSEITSASNVEEQTPHHHSPQPEHSA